MGSLNFLFHYIYLNTWVSSYFPDSDINLLPLNQPIGVWRKKGRGVCHSCCHLWHYSVLFRISANESCLKPNGPSVSQPLRFLPACVLWERRNRQVPVPRPAASASPSPDRRGGARGGEGGVEATQSSADPGPRYTSSRLSCCKWTWLTWEHTLTLIGIRIISNTVHQKVLWY